MDNWRKQYETIYEKYKDSQKQLLQIERETKEEMKRKEERLASLTRKSEKTINWLKEIAMKKDPKEFTNTWTWSLN